MTTRQVTVSQCKELQSNPGFYLLEDAQLAWDRTCQEFGKKVLITGAWRSYQTQVELFDSEKYPKTGRYVRGNHAGERGFTNDVRGRTADGSLYRGSWWTRKAWTAAAAVPGTSNHGGAIAVDAKTQRQAGDPPYEEAVVFTSFSDEDRLRFLRIGAKNGWDDAEGQQVKEWWHLTWYANQDKFRGQRPKTEEDDMPTIAEIKKAVAEEIRAEASRKLRVPANLREYLGETATRDQILVAIAFRTTVVVRSSAEEKEAHEEMAAALKELDDDLPEG